MNRMSKQGTFLIYCIEIYRKAKQLSGKETVELFERCNVFDFIISCYESLHTTSEQCTVADIQEIIDGVAERTSA